MIHVHVGTKLQSMVAKRHLKCSYPYVKKSFKIQYGIIPIDPAILAAIGHRKFKMPTCGSEGMRAETGDFLFLALNDFFT